MPDPCQERLTQLAAAYRAGRITRRVFIRRLVSVLGGSALADRILEASGWAQNPVPPREPPAPGIQSTAVNLPGEGATLLGYLSRPPHREDATPVPALLLIHENRGLDEHIRAVARRLAAEGYVVLAVDHLSRQGGTRTFLSPDEAAAAVGKLGGEDIVRDLEAAASYLAGHSSVEPERIGVMGFGWGGQGAFLYATVNPTLKAAVVFYGAPPPEDSLAAIQTPVLGHYAENDDLVTTTVTATQAVMQRLGKSFDARVYPAAERAFFNDTGPRYNEAAAQDAWTRTLAFLKQHLATESS